jgi:hypothetical protein
VARIGAEELAAHRLRVRQHPLQAPVGDILLGLAGLHAAAAPIITPGAATAFCCRGGKCPVSLKSRCAFGRYIACEA